MGERFGPFELLEPLGSGGMAEVWRALYRGESGFAKEVALKRILTERMDQPNLVTWFHDEARLCSRLKHLNIVEVYDFGTIEGTPYLSMEYVQGWTLSQVLARCRAHGAGLPVPAVVELGIQTCVGLSYAHGATDADGAPLGVIHRDLKPANLMVSADGLVKVMDFGIAKATSNEFRTETDSVRGTPSYLSPEVCDGRAADHRADLFTLGSILVEAALGYPLFLEESTYRTMYRIAQADVARELADVRALDPALADVLDRTLRADPEERFEDADAMRFALQAISGEKRGAEVLLGAIRKALAQPDPGGDEDPGATEPRARRTELLSESAATRSWEEEDGADDTREVEADWERARGRRSWWWLPAIALAGAAVAAMVLVPDYLERQRQEGPAEEGPTGAVDDGEAAAEPASPAARDPKPEREPATVAPPAEPVTPEGDEPTTGDEPAAGDEPGEETPAFTLQIPDEAAVGSAIQSDEALRGCFEQAAARGEEPPRSVSLVFRMGPSGRFESALVDGPMPPALEQCLTARLKQMEFGESSFQWDGRATLSYRPAPPPPE